MIGKTSAPALLITVFLIVGCQGDKGVGGDSVETSSPTAKAATPSPITAIPDVNPVSVALSPAPRPCHLSASRPPLLSTPAAVAKPAIVKIDRAVWNEYACLRVDSIVLTKPGGHAVLVSFTIENRGSEGVRWIDSQLSLVDADGVKYFPVITPTPTYVRTVAPGEQSAGQVEFRVPAGVLLQHFEWTP